MEIATNRIILKEIEKEKNICNGDFLSRYIEIIRYVYNVQKKNMIKNNKMNIKGLQLECCYG